MEDPATDQLQFKKAEFADDRRRCALCQVPIANTYYHCAGRVICEGCATQRAALQKPAEAGLFARALLYGLGAAVAGSVLFAVVAMATGHTFSLISILVGIMVGKTIMRATRGHGGRRYQVLAVILTYGAITTSFIPELLQAARTQQQRTPRQANAASTGKAPESPAHRPAAVQAAVAMAILLGIALISPVLILITSPVSGVLNALIIVFGLFQAWRQTRGDDTSIMGPYHLESA
ncbi:MAG: hypothetical protein DMG59_24940 [Acidobacteria bacterium]|nr:MAG: hypothetical protein DMG59_24940 [Acidobacteriota bacterium]